MCLNLKPIFWKQCIITEQWNTVMTPNFAHKIVHSSAMYYQNLIMIHECSKKLLKMKNSKCFFLTPSTCRRGNCHRLCLAIMTVWFSMEHHWIMIMSFWLSTDNMSMSNKRVIWIFWSSLNLPSVELTLTITKPCEFPSVPTYYIIGWGPEGH